MDIVAELRAYDTGRDITELDAILEKAAAEIERLRAAVATEREECARVAEERGHTITSYQAFFAKHGVGTIEEAIRARGGEQ